ncbi:DJ-1 protein-PfpI domain-containing protein [Mycena venus]|uniref:DJ-1 protein-PfpI domain-containing protein n=1 Tax=Mycena venus TaxID=2733690 RepID=A0A8H6XR67_9AGAR|nr:DJ-1 protein-PfpI domain-containing protein [Mycena venus]
MPETLAVAVCVYPGVTLSDFIPNVEILAGFNNADHPMLGKAMGEIPYRLKFDYISTTMDPVVSIGGASVPTFNPTTTYAKAMASGQQYDIFFLPPAGPVPDFEAGDNKVPEGLIPFLTAQAPKAKYLLSVCAGSFYLALAGLLSGKKATTNKAFYRLYVAAAPKDIEWVAKARWVVDGKIWTSSGVTAGSDMTLAFVEHLASAQASRFIRGMMEIPEVTKDDDPFAEWHGLV